MKISRINHIKLVPGLYKNSVSGLVTTWDIRLKSPNKGDYLTPEIIHTIEHTMSQYLSKRFGYYRVLGVFPLGDQTGFYILTRFIDKGLIYESIVDYIMNLQRLSSVSDANEFSCGQYKLQDLRGAKNTMMNFYEYIKYRNSAVKYDN